MKSSASTSPTTPPDPSPFRIDALPFERQRLLGSVYHQSEFGENDLNIEERTLLLSAPPEKWSSKMHAIVAKEEQEIAETQARMREQASLPLAQQPIEQSSVRNLRAAKGDRLLAFYYQDGEGEEAQQANHVEVTDNPPNSPFSLPNRKPAGYSAPDALTPQEIESLRQDARESSAEMKAYLAAIIPGGKRLAK